MAPLIALLAIRALAGDRAGRWLKSTEQSLQRSGQVVLSAVAGIAGVAFLSVGAAGLLMA